MHRQRALCSDVAPPFRLTLPTRSARSSPAQLLPCHALASGHRILTGEHGMHAPADFPDATAVPGSWSGLSAMGPLTPLWTGRM